jgi:uncharacterized membrane protein
LARGWQPRSPSSQAISADELAKGGVAMRIAQFISLLLYSLVSAVFWGTWLGLSRSIGGLSAATFLDIGHTMIANLGGPMPFLMPGAVLATLGLVLVLRRRRERLAVLLGTLALALLLGAMAITLLVNVPIDNQIHEWTIATLPSTWEGIRDRWEFFHGLRTFVSLAGLACLFGSVVATTRPAPTFIGVGREPS